MRLYSVPVACTSQCSRSSVTRDVLNIRVVDLASQKSPEQVHNDSGCTELTVAGYNDEREIFLTLTLTIL